VGLSNFRYILVEDDVFLSSILHSFAFVIIGGGAIIFLAFLTAYLLFSGALGGRVYRVVYFIPFVLPSLVVSILWKTIYDPNFGLLTATLRALGLEALNRVWLGDLDITLYAVIWVYVWRSFPFHMILFFVGLQDLPQELLEAAELDGASTLQRIRFVILPLLTPVLIVVASLCILWGLRVFDIVYVMTRGGPGHSTETVSTWMITNAFSYGHFGTGAAMAVVLFLLVLILTVLPSRFRRGIY
jgi:raffinose/stachyose/melibiose transport system permease protein